MNARFYLILSALVMFANVHAEDLSCDYLKERIEFAQSIEQRLSGSKDRVEIEYVAAAQYLIQQDTEAMTLQNCEVNDVIE